MQYDESLNDSAIGVQQRANVPSISTRGSGSGSVARSICPAPLGALPAQATLTPVLVDSLRRQALQWSGMDAERHRAAFREVDLFARAWRESEYDKLAHWPTVTELAQLLDRLAVALNMALPSSETLSVYFDELRIVPTPLLTAGLSHLLRGYKYARFPPIAEILEAADEAARPLLADLHAANAYCWKVERFMIDRFPHTQRQRAWDDWQKWRVSSERPLRSVAGPFSPPPRENRTSSRSR